MYTNNWINELGTFQIFHKIKDGNGSRITNKYLRTIIEEIARNSSKQLIETNLIPPFAYREKQFHTVMAPAISKVSDYYLMESPVQRNWSRLDINTSDQHGWVDYWSSYKNYDYYIELKHGFRAYQSKVIRQTEIEKWEEACLQLESLQDEIIMQKEHCEGIFPITFHALPIYVQSKNKEKLSKFLFEPKDIQIETMESISEKFPSNWSCLWTLDDSINNVHEYVDGYEKYPAILFLVKVFDKK